MGIPINETSLGLTTSAAEISTEPALNTNQPPAPGELADIGGLMSAAATYLASIDWKRLFIAAVIVVNVFAVIYGLSKIGAAYAIGGATYAVVTGGTTVAYMVFFAAFAVVMIRKYEGYSMLATVMTLLCAFVI
ncbi:MAG: hypothetical protein HZT40_22480 [Candidatus Thiothrix singaporensis]|uniref:Uncharacterized protein n=1 Tax=Candidatus Thiothrix singaporensis TaxID=2799669 RepID=A0A7L6AXQ1_9GAMM|nr:MAG: hypothetical protein HZT40_22480 [Candidatus Thiothrix singaporensis]